ncbi:MAG TPA: cation:proton antiporter [Spirochaetia bacterium]
MDLMLTLSVSLVVALVLGFATQKLGLSPIVGYLLAGIIVGPNTPGFIANHEIAEQLAEIGVVLLMFGVGIHFDLKELLGMRHVALPGAAVQSAVATILGAVAAMYLSSGHGWASGIVYGLALSVASTVVLTRVLADADELHTPGGHIAVGWTVVEDILTVLILVILPAVSPHAGSSGGPLALSIGIAIVKIGALFAFAFLVGGRVIPWLLKKVAATKSRELFTLTILVVALGIAFGSAKLFGVSMALGAFLAGMIVGRSDFSLRAASEALPMRDAFAVLFFVSVGMLFDPKVVVESPWLVIATVGIVIVGKPLVSFLIMVALGNTIRSALTVGLALGQIGEFSFILAQMGTQLGILPQSATSAIVAVAIVTIALSPIYHRLAKPIDSWVQRRRKLVQVLTPRQLRAETERPEPAESAGPEYQAVVIGYGPVGRTLVRLLRDNDVTASVIELNLKTVDTLRRQGITAVYGDARQRETLLKAGIASAGSLILSASTTADSQEIIRMAREINPTIRIIARTAYLRERSPLILAGADVVLTGEGEVALAMNDTILRELGATPDQIDREREALQSDIGSGEL